jgi:DnaA family protein
MTFSSALPRQFALDLSHARQAKLDNFLATGNTDLLNQLHAVKTSWLGNKIGANNPLNQRWIYWWGESGSGCTHLLKAMQSEAIELSLNTLFLEAQNPSHWIQAEENLTKWYEQTQANVICIDDIEQLDERQQASLFRILNLIQASQASFILMCGKTAPANLKLREDLRTRIAWGLVYQLHTLSDQDKMAALKQAAQDRGLVLSAEILEWLLKRFFRDMPSLMGLLDALDAYSLETKRAITLPLVRELLQAPGKSAS